MGSARRLIAPIVLLGPLLLPPACSEDEPAPLVEPSSAFQPTGSTGNTAAIGSSGATGQTGGLPTVSLPTTAGAATGTVRNGQAAFALTGDIRTSKALANLVSPVYASPPGGMALVWTAGGTDPSTVGIGGLSFAGTQPTSPTLSLTITVQDENAITTFISSAGECRITIGQASADRSRERSPARTCPAVRTLSST